MVRQTATLFCEEVVTFAQSSDHIIEIGDSNIANFCQLFYITTEISRDFYSHSLIRTPSWQHLDFKSAFTCFDVIFQWIDRIIRSTNYLYVIATHHSTSWIFRLRQLFVTFIVNFACCLRIQYFIDTKCSFQFEVSPVVQWITESIRNCFRPFFEFFPVCGIFSCAETFIYAVCTHCTPFVVVTA